MAQQDAIITPKQLRAARALAGITQNELAELSGVSRNIIVAMEHARTVRPAAAFNKVRHGLDKLGVVLIGDDELSRSGGRGVRLK